MQIIAIVSLVIIITEILKFRFNINKVYIPAIIFVLSGIFNVINVAIFVSTDKMTLLLALKDGLEYALLSAGSYSMGKVFVETGKEKYNEKFKKNGGVE